MLSMRWFGPAVEVETVEASDHLLFRVTKLQRWVDLLLPILCGVGFIIALSRGSGIWIIGLAVFCGIFLYNFLNASTTELLVTRFDLTANLRRYFWKDIRSLEYQRGGEDERSGLYARKGRWRSVCLVPDLNEEQTTAIIASIYRRFPLVEMAGEESGFGTMLREVAAMLHPSNKSKKGKP